MAGLYTLVWTDPEGITTPIGYLPQRILDVLHETPPDVRGPMAYDAAARTVTLFDSARTEPERTAHVARLTAHWRAERTFSILVRGWRDELWPVYGRDGALLFRMERAAVGLLGANRYGIHMVAYVRQPAATAAGASRWPFRVWVPRRAAAKESFAGMLDNTVAGGLAAADASPREALVREADEEASLPAGLVRDRAREAGLVSYIYLTDARAGGDDTMVYPECQYVYHLELPADGSVVPRPKDGEVESFTLCTVEEIQEQLRRGLWKPNCAVVMLHFFIKFGVLTRQNEPHLDDICRRLRRKLPFPGPHEGYSRPDEKLEVLS